MISPEITMEAVYSTKQRAIKLVKCKGEAFEGRNAGCGIRL
jgi:hypothetical protein